MRLTLISLLLRIGILGFFKLHQVFPNRSFLKKAEPQLFPHCFLFLCRKAVSLRSSWISCGPKRRLPGCYWSPALSSANALGCALLLANRSGPDESRDVWLGVGAPECSASSWEWDSWGKPPSCHSTHSILNLLAAQRPRRGCSI